MHVEQSAEWLIVGHTTVLYFGWYRIQPSAAVFLKSFCCGNFVEV